MPQSRTLAWWALKRRCATRSEPAPRAQRPAKSPDSNRRRRASPQRLSGCDGLPARPSEQLAANVAAPSDDLATDWLRSTTTHINRMCAARQVTSKAERALRQSAILHESGGATSLLLLRGAAARQATSSSWRARLAILGNIPGRPARTRHLPCSKICRLRAEAAAPMPSRTHQAPERQPRDTPQHAREVAARPYSPRPAPPH